MDWKTDLIITGNFLLISLVAKDKYCRLMSQAFVIIWAIITILEIYK